MKTLRWNVGLMIIKVGYPIRKRIWFIGVAILGIGFKIRGQVPMRHWFNYGKF